MDFETYRARMEGFVKKAEPDMTLLPEEAAAYHEETEMSPAEAAAAYLGQLNFEMREPVEDYIMTPNDAIEHRADILGDSTLCDQW